MFRDEWNPKLEEIRHWAYDRKAMFPCEDWPLALENLGFEEHYMEFVVDEQCPKRAVFLNVLYLIVGDTVRGGSLTSEPPAFLEELFEKAKSLSDQDLNRWANESKALLSNPETFDYEYWCGSRF